LVPVAVAAAALVIALGYAPLLSLVGIEIDDSTTEEVFENAGPFLVTAIGAILLAPVIEEVFFRGFLFGGLRARWGWLVAAAVSSLIFGAGHLSGIYLPPYTAIGFLFAWSYNYTASLKPGIIAHALTNTVTIGIGLAATFS
jgi:membrane protease YdiL (CAAX protease family)